MREEASRFDSRLCELGCEWFQAPGEEPLDFSYVYGGYAPLSVRVVQLMSHNPVGVAREQPILKQVGGVPYAVSTLP